MSRRARCCSGMVACTPSRSGTAATQVFAFVAPVASIASAAPSLCAVPSTSIALTSSWRAIRRQLNHMTVWATLQVRVNASVGWRS
jgi:hypothetical protein